MNTDLTGSTSGDASVDAHAQQDLVQQQKMPRCTMQISCKSQECSQVLKLTNRQVLKLINWHMTMSQQSPHAQTHAYML